MPASSHRAVPPCSTGSFTRWGLADGAPTTLRALRTRGQRSPGELIERYGIACGPVRNLLVDYLRERQPALDYTSLESLAHFLRKTALGRHRGPPPRHQQPAAARRGGGRLEATPGDEAEDHQGRSWREDQDRRRSDQPPGVPDPGEGPLPGPGPLGGRGPGALGRVGRPCPVSENEINRKKALRRRKSRMDAAPASASPRSLSSLPASSASERRPRLSSTLPVGLNLAGPSRLKDEPFSAPRSRSQPRRP